MGFVPLLLIWVTCEKFSDVQKFLLIEVNLIDDPLIPELPQIFIDEYYDHTFKPYDGPTESQKECEFNLDVLSEHCERDLSRLMSTFEEVEGFKVMTKKQLVELKRQQLNENFEEVNKRSSSLENSFFVEINRFGKDDEPDYELGPLNGFVEGEKDSNKHLLKFMNGTVPIFRKKKVLKQNGLTSKQNHIN